VGPAQVLPPRLFDRDVLDLAARLDVEVSPEFEARFPAKAIASVEITVSDGQRYDSGAVEARWEPPDTLPTDDELREKFIWLVSPVLGRDRALELMGLIWGFDRVVDARQLIKLSLAA